MLLSFRFVANALAKALSLMYEDIPMYRQIRFRFVSNVSSFHYEENSMRMFMLGVSWMSRDLSKAALGRHMEGLYA